MLATASAKGAKLHSDAVCLERIAILSVPLHEVSYTHDCQLHDVPHERSRGRATR